MTPDKPLSEEECASLHAELTDWEQDGFVAAAANNVTKVWAGRAKRCASIFKNLLTTITALRAQLEEAQRERDALRRTLSEAVNTGDVGYLRSESKTLEAALRGEQGIVFEDGYEVNVAALRDQLATAEASLAAAEKALNWISENADDEGVLVGSVCSCSLMGEIKKRATAALQGPK